MGLKEKRAIEQCKTEKLNEWTEKVESVCGKKLDWNINWDELVKEGYTEYYPGTVDWNFFAPLAESLKSICADKLGKDSFTQKINKVNLTSNRSWSSLEVKIEGDTLHLDADPSYQRDDTYIADYAGRITAALEAAL